MVKINSLEIENIKKVKAVSLEPTANGLTVIGGRNGAGKTSVLDSICWALGGEKYRPSKATRDGSNVPGSLKVALSNGIVVSRKGDKGSLKVMDPSGEKGGQTLLNEFVHQLALDLPKFLNSSDKEKARTLLDTLGIGEELAKMDQEERELYNERHAIGKIADQKKKHAAEMPYHQDAPPEPVAASELIKQQQEILAKNGENQRKRQRVEEIKRNRQNLEQQMQVLADQIKRLQEDHGKLSAQLVSSGEELETAQKTAEQLQDESTAEIEQRIEDIENINAMVRANQEKLRAEYEAKSQQAEYNAITEKIDDVRTRRMALLEGANMPLDNLTVEGGELIYNSQRWDCMSGSEQLRVATAIVRKLNPDCGFVLLDKLEQMDRQTMTEFGEWLTTEGLQAIATRVSTDGDECSLVIEDGTGEYHAPNVQLSADGVF
jgi:DNA repair exonuclease SbcCD ATPase subunit